MKKRPSSKESLSRSQGSHTALPFQSLAPLRVPFLSKERARASAVGKHQEMKKAVMQCARCTGMSIPEVIVEGGARLFAMCCIHCGDVIYRIIPMNRRRHRHLRWSSRSLGKGLGQSGAASHSNDSEMIA
jgi:hypothetical protein